jgi:hypothetical protein
MSGTIPPLPQYAFMAWCSFKKSTGTTLPLRRDMGLHLSDCFPFRRTSLEHPMMISSKR